MPASSFLGAFQDPGTHTPDAQKFFLTRVGLKEENSKTADELAPASPLPEACVLPTCSGRRDLKAAGPSELGSAGSVNKSPPSGQLGPGPRWNGGEIQEGILLVPIRAAFYCLDNSVRVFFFLTSASNLLTHSQPKKALSVLSALPSKFTQKPWPSQILHRVMEKALLHPNCSSPGLLKTCRSHEIVL